MSNFLFQVQAKEILSVLKNIQPITPKRFPLNKSIYFKKNENGLTVTTQQFKVTLNQDLQVPTCQDFTFYVDLDTLKEALKDSKGCITFNLDLSDNRLNIAYGAVTKTIDLSSPNDFTDNELYFDRWAEVDLLVQEASFLAALKTVLHSISTDETKQVLGYMNIALDGNKVTLASTDGHRLTTHEMNGVNLTSKLDDRFNNIPLSVIKSLITLLNSKSKKDLKISRSNTDPAKYQITNGQFCMIFSVWDMSYPHLNLLLPKHIQYQIKLPLTQDVIDFLKGIKAEKYVKLEQNFDGNLTISNDPSGSYFTVSNPQGEFDVIAFQPKYLLECLEAIIASDKNLGQALLEYEHSHGPVIIKVSSTLHLLMPTPVRK